MKNGFQCAVVAALAVAAAGLSAGCGGGNVSDESANGSTRAVGINAAQAARRLNVLLSTGFDAPARSRARRARTGRQTGASPVFDATHGLYVTVEETETATRQNFFTDAAGQNSAGFYEIAAQGDPERFPVTLVISYGITAGLRPGEGRVEVVVDDELGESGRFSGRDRNVQSGLSLVIDLAFSGATTTGQVTATDDDGTVEFRDIVLDEGGFRASLGRGAGAVTQNADGSGTLTLAGGGGTLAASWDEEGAGTIQPPGGAVENVADFDTEP